MAQEYCSWDPNDKSDENEERLRVLLQNCREIAVNHQARDKWQLLNKLGEGNIKP